MKTTSEKAKSASKVSSRSHLGDTSCVPKLRFPRFATPWKTTPLSRLLRFQNGVNAPAEKYGRGVKFVSVSDIIQNDYVTYDNIAGSVDIDEATLERYSVENGDMVFQRSSETVEDIGRANVYLDNRTATFGGFVIRGKKIGEYNPYFFKCLLYSNEARHKVIRVGAGAQHYNIGQEALSQIHLHFPEMAEQRRIADLLLLVSNRIVAQRKLVELLKKHKRGLLQSVFADGNGKPKLRFPGFEGEWEVRSLETLGDVLRGVSFDGATDVHTTETPRTIRLLRSNNVQEGQIVLDDVKVISRDRVAGSQIMRANDILICMANGSRSLVGKAALFTTYPQEYTFGAFMGVYRCHHQKDAYLVFLLLNSFKYRRELSILLSGSSINNLRPSDITSMRFHVPCGQEQMKLTRFLSFLDGRIAAEERMEVRLETVKRGLLQQLFV